MEFDRIIKRFKAKRFKSSITAKQSRRESQVKLWQQFRHKLILKLRNGWPQLKIVVSSCMLCRGKADQHPLLCRYCQQDLQSFNLTKINDDLLNWPAISDNISHQHYDHFIALAPHQWPYSQWLAQLKYQGHCQLADLLATLLAKQLKQYIARQTVAGSAFTQHTPVALGCIPLHFLKWQQRGFNQSHLIANSLAKQLSLPYHPELLTRAKATKQQVGLTGSERRKNLSGAFKVAQPDLVAHYQHWLLFDDVVTTGTTTNEVCRMLKLAGATEITVISITLATPS